LVKGKLKVIDFGIAKRISNDTTNISRDAGVGTLSYMAPEAVKNGTLKLGRSSDIWSLGIILYQLVYSHPPFSHLEPVQRVFLLNSPDLKIAFPEGHCLDDHSPSTKANLVDVLSSCLQREPRRRSTLPQLLRHPFLSVSVEVRRDVMTKAVTSLMSQVVKKLGEAVEADAFDVSTENWESLADEVWDHLSASKDSSSASATPDFNSLSALSVITTRMADMQKQREAALAEARRHEARNLELEEQLRRLQHRIEPSRGLASNENTKDRGQHLAHAAKLQHRSDDKENIRHVGEGKSTLSSDASVQRQRFPRHVA